MPDAGLVLRAFCLARVCLARSGCPAWPREQQEDRAQRDQRRTFHVNVGPALSLHYHKSADILCCIV